MSFNPQQKQEYPKRTPKDGWGEGRQRIVMCEPLIAGSG